MEIEQKSKLHYLRRLVSGFDERLPDFGVLIPVLLHLHGFGNHSVDLFPSLLQ